MAQEYWVTVQTPCSGAINDHADKHSINAYIFHNDDLSTFNV